MSGIEKSGNFAKEKLGDFKKMDSLKELFRARERRIAVIVKDVLGEDLNDDVLVTEHFVNALGVKRVIGRMFCELEEPSVFRACETFSVDWERTLFPADDDPIRSDDDLCRHVNEGLEAEGLPRTDEGVVQLVSIWIFS